MQFLYMQQYQEVLTVCFIFLQLHMNSELRLQEIHLTDYTVVHIIFLMYVQQEDGQMGSVIRHEDAQMAAAPHLFRGHRAPPFQYWDQ